jgi:hypothetical protein
MIGGVFVFLGWAIFGSAACGDRVQEQDTSRSKIVAVVPLPDPGDGGCPAAAQTFSDTVTINGTSSATATKGKYMRGGMELETSAAAVRREDEHAKHYNGPTKFTATYSIVVDGSGVLDKSMSTVTFKTINFTDQGRLTTSSFTTNAINVTGVTLSGDCPPKLKAFTFHSDDWYPAGERGAGGLMNRTLDGSIDLSAGKATYTAKYAIKANGAIYTYGVSGTIAMPSAPCPSAAVVDGPDAGTSACDGGDSSGGGAVPGTEEDYEPALPFEELAAAGTPCDSSTECDVGLSCTSGYCE